MFCPRARGGTYAEPLRSHGQPCDPSHVGIYEGEEEATGKVVAISTSSALGLSVFLQHRVNEERRCDRLFLAFTVFSETLHFAIQ